MPSPAAKVTSTHELITNIFQFLHALTEYYNSGRVAPEIWSESGRKRRRVSARIPEGCPCAKTPCMAKHHHQTW
eukprot:1686052-Amphidinium_carterae.1